MKNIFELREAAAEMRAKLPQTPPINKSFLYLGKNQKKFRVVNPWAIF